LATVGSFYADFQEVADATVQHLLHAVADGQPLAPSQAPPPAATKEEAVACPPG
jgi:hypothetical protein